MKDNTISNDKLSVLSISSIYIIVFVTLFLLVDFIPQFQTIDAAGLHWFFIALINSVMGYHLFSKLKSDDDKSITIGIVSLLYFGFIFCSGISIFFADNKIESLYTFNRLFTICNTVLFFKIFSKKTENTLLYIAVSVSIVLFLQSFFSFFAFLSSLKNYDSNVVMKIMRDNYGNVNIRAASILFKIPFVFFCIYHFNGLKKYFFTATLFFATIFVLLTSSRTNILSLSILLVLLTIITIVKKFNYKNLLIVILTLSLSFLTAKYYSKYVSTDSFAELLLGGNVDKDDISNGRFTLWGNTINLIKEKPLSGHGFGQYKINVIPYEGKQRFDWRISKYSHNDFLQVFSESGVVTAVLYLSLFGFLFLYFIRKVFKSENECVSWNAAVIVMMIIAIGFDSMLNFPLYRPTTQVLFAILMLLVFYNFDNNSKVYFKLNSKYIVPVFVLLSIGSMYPHYKHYKSLYAQNIILQDEKNLTKTYSEINSVLDDSPNLTDLGYPTKYVKARYLNKEGKIKEAFELLYSSIKDKENNNIVTNQALLAEIYEKLKVKDSAFKYWKQSYESYPTYEAFYSNMLIHLTQQKDTTKIINLVNQNLQYKYNPKFLFVATKYMIDAGIPYKRINTLLKEDYAKHSEDTLVKKAATIISQNVKSNIKSVYHIQTTAGNTTDTNTANNSPDKQTEITNLLLALKSLPKEGKWNEKTRIYKILIKEYPTNPSVIENLGVSLYRLKKYNEAIPYLKKVSEMKASKNGKAEYLLAASYHYLKQSELACQYAKMALANNYIAKDAQEIINKHCK